MFYSAYSHMHPHFEHVVLGTCAGQQGCSLRQRRHEFRMFNCGALLPALSPSVLIPLSVLPLSVSFCISSPQLALVAPLFTQHSVCVCAHS